MRADTTGPFTPPTTPEQKLRKHRRAVAPSLHHPVKQASEGSLIEKLRNIVAPLVFSSLETPSTNHAPDPRPLIPDPLNPAPGPRPLAPTAGLTLMEMIVVVAIIAVVAGISFPSISSGIDSVRLRSATDSTAAFLNAAVVRTERRQEPIELIVSPNDSTIQLLSNEPGFTRLLRMPDGIAIEGVVPSDPDEEGPRRLILLPGAAVPALGIRLANRHGSRRVVHLDPMTGFPRVESIVTK
jgi:prepilin-type N-terminal cleavage/methylation domain-containing protein